MCLGAEDQRGIDRGMGMAAGRPGLDAGAEDQPGAVMGRRDLRRPGIGRHAGEQALGPFQNEARAAQACRGQLGRLYPAGGGAGGVELFGGHRLVPALPEPGGTGGGGAERAGHTCLVQPHQRGRGRGRPEGAAGGGGVEMAVMGGAHGAPQAHHRLVTAHHRIEQGIGAAAQRLGHGQRRRDDHGARMQHRLAVDIVHFVNIAIGAVGEGGVAGGGAPRTQHPRRPGRPTRGKTRKGPAGFGRRPDHGTAGPVEHRAPRPATRRRIDRTDKAPAQLFGQAGRAGGAVRHRNSRA